MMQIYLAKRGKISLIPGVVRDCDRQEFVIRTNKGIRAVRLGDAVIKFGRATMLLPLPRLTAHG